MLFGQIQGGQKDEKADKQRFELTDGGADAVGGIHIRAGHYQRC